MRLDRMPLSIQARQVEGGREFAAAFRTRPVSNGIRLFVLPPRSPNSMARSNAPIIQTEEFYEAYTGDLDLFTLRPA